MSDALDAGLLEAVLDSWDRNNTILVNLLRAVAAAERPAEAGRPTEAGKLEVGLHPAGGPTAAGRLEVRAMEGGPSVAELFTHIHYVRLVFVLEDAPEFARKMPEEEWAGERDPERIAQMLNESAKAVRDAVKSRLESGRDMDLHYDHPILLLQHMIWHEGYHHGQIKLALKLAGRAISDEEAGPVTWGVWMREK